MLRPVVAVCQFARRKQNRALRGDGKSGRRSSRRHTLRSPPAPDREIQSRVAGKVSWESSLVVSLCLWTKSLAPVRRRCNDYYADADPAQGCQLVPQYSVSSYTLCTVSPLPGPPPPPPPRLRRASLSLTLRASGPHLAKSGAPDLVIPRTLALT